MKIQIWKIREQTQEKKEHPVHKKKPKDAAHISPSKSKQVLIIPIHLQ
jgi:hypothetical protein